VSYYFDVGTDTLRVTVPTLTIGTGPVMQSAWWKKRANNGTTSGIFMIGDALNPTGTQRLGLLILGDETMVAYYGGGATSATIFTPTLNTNYGLVVSRDGTNLRVRVFADDAGLTKLFDFTEADADSLTTIDEVLLGTRDGGSILSQVQELLNYKLHTHSSEWTDSECRTELSRWTLQKSGGTDRHAFQLNAFDESTAGLRSSASTALLTNTGCTAGAMTIPVSLVDGPSARAIRPTHFLPLSAAEVF